ncbi:MAG: phosphatase PAP2 family protein [Bacillales bacterium]|jgi:undecaprenyl-diphosphatase|nr:phosphatase PAP2 family protein [Bacillales bacterium]
MKRKIIDISLLSLCFLVFIVLAILQKSGTLDFINTKFGLNAQVIVNTFLTNIVVVITNFGEWFFYVPVIIILLIIPRTRLVIGLPEAIMMTISTIINMTLKEILAVERPTFQRLIEPGGYSFPSGHAMHSMVFVGVLFIVLLNKIIKNNLKGTLITVGILFVLIIGWTRIYLGVHTITDIIAGYFIGLGIVLSYDLIRRILKEKKELKTEEIVK